MKDEYKPLMGDDYKSISDMESTRPPSQVLPDEPEAPQTYDEFKSLVFEYFERLDYECNLAFTEGYGKSTGEDHKSIDILQNLNSLIYNYITNRNKSLSAQDKINFHDLFEAMQLLTKSMNQYDDKKTEKIFVAHLAGYILKLMRNFYHA